MHKDYAKENGLIFNSQKINKLFLGYKNKCNVTVSISPSNSFISQTQLNVEIIYSNAKLLTHFSKCTHSLPPENIRKP